MNKEEELAEEEVQRSNNVLVTFEEKDDAKRLLDQIHEYENSHHGLYFRGAL